MDIIKQIVKSRQILKEVLSEEYDTSNLPIYSIDEIDKLFSFEPDKVNRFSTLGQGSACNFTLNHKILKKHKLHILYYNFKKDGKTKVTKTIIDKIKCLYEESPTNVKGVCKNIYNDSPINPTDNIIIILNESIRDTIKNLNNSLNLLLKEEDFDMKNIENDMKKNNLKLERKHFRNVFMFDIKTLQFNILKHKYVPKHEVIRDNDSIQQILKNCNCSIDQLPIISKEDPVSKIKMCISGDLCKITRINKTSGSSIYYRVCR